MDEHQLITMLRPLAAPEADNFSNDAAALTIPDKQELVVTTDTLIAGVHFIGDEPPALIAQKALRVNLSDLAAMSATPYRYNLALSLPKGTDAAWCERFVAGLAEDQTRYDISLLGGDTTTTSGPLTITITAMGLAQSGVILTRTGAQEGDNIYVTGTLGDAALGLMVAQGELPENTSLLNRYHLPQPRLEALHLLQKYAAAAMDISDGLAQDLNKLCAASNVGAVITETLIPSSRGLTAESERSEDPRDDMVLNAALYGGDDYELLFTASAEHQSAITEAAQNLSFLITKIGTITAKSGGIMLQQSDATIPLKSDGYMHKW